MMPFQCGRETTTQHAQRLSPRKIIAKIHLPLWFTCSTMLGHQFHMTTFHPYLPILFLDRSNAIAITKET